MALANPRLGDSGWSGEQPADEIPVYAGDQGDTHIRGRDARFLSHQPGARAMHEQAAQKALHLGAGDAEFQEQIDQRLDGNDGSTRDGGAARSGAPGGGAPANTLVTSRLHLQPDAAECKTILP